LKSGYAPPADQFHQDTSLKGRWQYGQLPAGLKMQTG